MPGLKATLFYLLIIFCVAACSSKHTQQQTIVYSLHTHGMPADQLANGMKITVYAEKGKALVEWASLFFTTKELITDTGSIKLTKTLHEKWISRERPLPGADSNWYKHAITYFEDTKKVAGYNCKKALVIERNGDTTIVWYTPQLPPAPFSAREQFFAMLKGMPLELDISNEKTKMTITAEKVSTEPIADSVFNLDTTGYKDLGAEMLRNMH